MTPNKYQYYDFADFRLDLSEKVLLRGGENVPITPKVFDTLEILLKNPGQLLGKDELMQRLWQDRFVEESNLTSNIKTLRKALGDDAAHPRFIETVPRRGYRFIAEVRNASNSNGINNGPAQALSEPSKLNRSASLRSKGLFAAVIMVLTGCIVVAGYWLAKTVNGGTRAPVLSASFALEKLSTNGKVLHAVISSDGKNVFYTNGIEGQQSVWLRQLDSSHSVEIIPPSDEFYYGLALSPDGNFLYFARSIRQVKDIGVYRVSIFGGVPTKLISGSEGWISISPDGSRISFVRCSLNQEEYCSLWVADALNGKNEKKLTSRPQPIRIGDNRISPDGKSVAFAVGQSQNQANNFGLEEIGIESGEVRPLTTEKFFNIRSLEWLPNKSGLLVTASRTPNKQFLIWEVSTADGGVKPLTNDSESYSRLSLNLASNILISTQVSQEFRLQIVDRDGASRGISAEASRAVYSSNSKLLLASAITGNDEIWSINTDGTEQKQLTNDLSDDIAPVASPDNEFVFFAANRTGRTQVWRMKSDGSDQSQLTSKEGGYPFFVSPDGKWVFYHHGVDRTLWRVSTQGGDEELVLNKRAIFFAISPDTRDVAFFHA
jgi:DNA-binding winged helix-turn-helix (wHTH) protein/Tol biopolymer transport system component